MKHGRRQKTKIHPWEHALTCPLPPDTSYHVLVKLRHAILEFLRDLPHDFTLDDGDKRDREIQRAADRLKIIARMIAAVPPVVERGAKDAGGQPSDDDENVQLVRCQDCGGTWVEWVKPPCPHCGRQSGTIWEPPQRKRKTTSTRRAR
jgi:hypothetical protein